MKRRVMFAGAAAIAGLLVPLAATTPPADAGTGVGCVGPQCTVGVWNFVHLGPKQNVGPSGNSTIPIDLPPPPCLWEPIGDATTGSQYIITNDGDEGPGSLFGIYQSVQQAKKLLKNPKPGTWYMLPVNPNAGAAGAAECLKLPLFVFEPPNVPPPMPNVPPVDLADYAYNHVIIPKPAVSTSADNNGQAWVNLATYAWATSPARVRVTATLGNESVTLVAKPGIPHITSSAGTPEENCGINGSHLKVGSTPKTAAGVPPDCGVLWAAPTTGATITATVTWTVTWQGDGAAGTLLPVTTTGTSQVIRVSEIQSINGTGNN